MNKDLITSRKPDPENSLIRALRMVGDHLQKQYAKSGRISQRDAWYVCKEEIERETTRMRVAGEASS